jgi:iron complex transport system substrate-binding protein
MSGMDNMRRLHSFHKWLLVLACLVNSLSGQALAAPKRVVSTFLCTDEYVFRLLPAERIAALSYEATDRHPVVSTIAAAATGIRAIRPSTETVLALKPDLVVMYAGTNLRLHTNLKKAGITILDVPWANSLAEVRQVTRMLGKELGVPEKAGALLAAMDIKIAVSKARAPKPPVRTIVYEPRGYATVQGVTKEVMTVAGMVDAAPPKALTRTGTLPVEALIATKPELLILGGEARNGTARAYALLHHPALRALEGKSHMAFADLTPLLCPGPWSLDSADPLGKLAREARAQNSAVIPGRASRSDVRGRGPR